MRGDLGVGLRACGLLGKVERGEEGRDEQARLRSLDVMIRRPKEVRVAVVAKCKNLWSQVRASARYVQQAQGSITNTTEGEHKTISHPCELKVKAGVQSSDRGPHPEDQDFTGSERDLCLEAAPHHIQRGHGDREGPEWMWSLALEVIVGSRGKECYDQPRQVGR